MDNFTYQFKPLRSDHTYTIRHQNGLITIEGPLSCEFKLRDDHHYHFDLNEEMQSLVIDLIFNTHPDLVMLKINHQQIKRDQFYQSSKLWLQNKEEVNLSYVKTGNITHPLRPKHFLGVHYKRFIPSLGKTISFRTITLNDLDTFHEWHNQERVSFFWELNKSKDELKKYIEDGFNKKHQIPMIVEFDGEPVGYYEFYWVKEDRLGPYYESRDFDRGFHFLIGNTRYLGRENTAAILQSGLHFIYLDDSRTQYVMAEPRHDNNRVLKYADPQIGWDTLKIFDFPHKRAVLLQNTKDRFFKGAKL